MSKAKTAARSAVAASAAIYREAARQIESGDHDTGCTENHGQTQGACDVLGHQGYMNRPDLADTFRDFFVREEGYYLMDNVCDTAQEATDCRILALCFMAAMVETGDA